MDSLGIRRSNSEEVQKRDKLSPPIHQIQSTAFHQTRTNEISPKMDSSLNNKRGTGSWRAMNIDTSDHLSYNDNRGFPFLFCFRCCCSNRQNRNKNGGYHLPQQYNQKDQIYHSQPCAPCTCSSFIIQLFLLILSLLLLGSLYYLKELYDKPQPPIIVQVNRDPSLTDPPTFIHDIDKDSTKLSNEKSKQEETKQEEKQSNQQNQNQQNQQQQHQQPEDIKNSSYTKIEQFLEMYKGRTKQESMISVHWNNEKPDVLPAMIFVIPSCLISSTPEVTALTTEQKKTIKGSDPMFIIDALYYSGDIQDGNQNSLFHMSALETDYNVFQFSLAPNGRDIDLIKPQLSIRSIDDESKDATIESSWTGWVTTLQLLGAVKNLTSEDISSYPSSSLKYLAQSCLNKSKFVDLIVVDASKLLDNRFYVIDTPLDPKHQITMSRVKDAAGFAHNVNFHVQIQQGLGTNKIDSSYTFSFSLLPKVPMTARIADDRIGYFTTDYSTVGFSKHITNPNKKRLHSVADRRIHIINRRRLERQKQYNKEGLWSVKSPLLYYIDPSVPKQWRSYIKKGIENWSVAFENAGYYNAIRAVLPGDKDFPSDYDAGDIRYSTISWSVVMDRTFAIGPATVDPRSGEILNSDIVVSHGWISSWLDDFESSRPDFRPPNQNTNREYQTRLRSHYGCSWDRLEFVQNDIKAARMILERNLDENSDSNDDERLKRVMNIIGLGLTDVIMHEVGHTLGLRHNFKGSLALPIDKMNDEAYIKEHGLTSSVMDYLALNIGSGSLDNLNDNIIFTSKVGNYDIQAIAYGYKHIDGILKEGNIEDINEELNEIAEKAGPFGTDEDESGFYGMDPENTVFDLTSDPLLYFNDQLKLTAKLQEHLESKLSEANKWDEYGLKQLDLISKAVTAGAHIAKFIAGYRFKKTVKYFRKDASEKLEPPFSLIPIEIQKRALSVVLKVLDGIADDGSNLFPRRKGDVPSLNAWSAKRNGYCNGIHQYCYGTSFIDLDQKIFMAKRKLLIDVLLNSDRLTRLAHGSIFDAQGAVIDTAQSLSPTYVFETISETLLGNPMFKKIELDKPKETLDDILHGNADKKTSRIAIITSQKLNDTHIWSLQNYWSEYLGMASLVFLNEFEILQPVSTSGTSDQDNSNNNGNDKSDIIRKMSLLPRSIKVSATAEAQRLYRILTQYLIEKSDVTDASKRGFDDWLIKRPDSLLLLQILSLQRKLGVAFTNNSTSPLFK